jgi:hypothetical protein
MLSWLVRNRLVFCELSFSLWVLMRSNIQDMAGPRAPRSAAKGAEVVVWLVLQPPGDQSKQGKFFADNQEIDYIEGEAK